MKNIEAEKAAQKVYETLCHEVAQAARDAGENVFEALAENHELQKAQHAYAAAMEACQPEIKGKYHFFHCFGLHLVG